MRTFRHVPAALALAALVGCGGYLPGLDPDDLLDWYYGSIAVNPGTLAGAITANQASQETADRRAIEACGSGACIVVLRYAGKDSCAALARAANGKYGVSAGSSRADATSQALAQCNMLGGQDCQPGLADCNDGQ